MFLASAHVVGVNRLGVVDVNTDVVVTWNLIDITVVRVELKCKIVDTGFVLCTLK